jgi:hypothetical protein
LNLQRIRIGVEIAIFTPGFPAFFFVCGTSFADALRDSRFIHTNIQTHRGAAMKAEKLWILAAVSMLAFAGCHKAESPATVQSDLAQARDAAAEKEGKANQKAAEALASVNADMAAQSQKADQKTADAAYDVAVARADGDHKIAVAKCEGLSGDAQKACVDQADAAQNLAKANAEAAKAARQ